MTAATRGGGGGGGGFWYGYHKDSHTSLVGVRELAGAGSHCFSGDAEVEVWLRSPEALWPSGGRRRPGSGQSLGLGLLAYPGQSNMTGRRLPLSWPAQVRSLPALRDTYTLLDCAALAMTSPLGGSVFRDVEAAPDFACVSFYKVFGFPDLGGLVVRRDSGHILALRRYFGGGTVTMVSVLGGAWHKTKGLDSTGAGGGSESGGEGYDIHDGLEDGTLPFHSIIALGEAMDVHRRVYGSMENVSRHTTQLSRRMYDGMRRLRHANGRPLCRIYAGDDDDDNSGGHGGFGDAQRQGATVAFNLVDADGGYVPYSDVERIANDSGVYVRSGG